MKVNKTLLSILLVLSMMVTMASADYDPPNQFYGDAVINGVDAPAGTSISAYIGDELRGSVEIGTAGEYGSDLNYLDVDGSESDDGKTIIFRINGDDANENAVWHAMSEPRKLDLSIGEPPAGAPADAQDASHDGAAVRPGPLPTVTPDGTIPVPEEGVTPASPEPTVASTKVRAPADEPPKNGLLPGFGAVFTVTITGLVAVAYLVRRRRQS